MLVQVALAVFALCAVLSLVVDAGYIRLTQGQMQVAADTAAIEGLRKRDVGVLNPANGQTVNDPFASDCIRRVSANRLVRWTYDDDFDLTDGDVAQYGAGPLISTDGGTTNLHALETISVPADGHAYKPNPQLNQQNAVHGDMVSGRFCYSADPFPSEGLNQSDTGNLVCTEPQNASGTYARNDFNPNSASPQPPVNLPACPAPDDAPPSPWPLGGTGTLDGVDDSAFLVRLRRTNELTEFSGQQETDVASSGPTVPLMFGMGTTIFGDDPAGGYSIRRDGVTVRATAIAQVRPALQVGLPQANASVPGVTPFVLVDTFVQVLNATGCPVTVTPATGLIVSAAGGAATCPAAGITVGRFVDNPAAPVTSRWRAVSRVGPALPAAVPTAACPALSAPVVSRVFAGYGPVYSTMSSGTNRIIGFTRIDLAPSACPAAPPAGVPAAFRATVSRGVSIVAAANATALAIGGLALPVAAAPAEVAQLIDKNLVRNGAVNYAPVLAPVLAR